MMTRAQEVAIATAVQQLRPDWDHPGIVAALRAAQAHGTPAEVAAAACRLAGDTNTRTPGRLKDPGAHWKAPAEGGPTVSVVVTSAEGGLCGLGSGAGGGLVAAVSVALAASRRRRVTRASVC